MYPNNHQNIFEPEYLASRMPCLSLRLECHVLAIAQPWHPHDNESLGNFLAKTGNMALTKE